jgi:hypothetical protein
MEVADADLGKWSRKAAEVATLMNETLPLAEVLQHLMEMKARNLAELKTSVELLAARVNPSAQHGVRGLGAGERLLGR